MNILLRYLDEGHGRGMLGWRNALGDVTPLSSFAFAGSDAFTIAGTPFDEDALYPP